MPLYSMALLASMVCQIGISPQRHFIPVGSPLPDFELQTRKGDRFSANQLEGKIGIVVFLRPNQSYSNGVLQDLEIVGLQLKGTAWEKVLIFSGKVAKEEIDEMIKTTGFSGTLLLDPDHIAYSKFDVVAVPSVAVFDKESRVIYSRPGFGVDFVSEVVKYLRKAAGVQSPEKEGKKVVPHSMAKIELARRLTEKGQLDKAEELLREVLAGETSLEAYLLLGDVLLQNKRPDGALKMVLEAREKFPKKEDHLEIILARAQAALGKSEEAKKILGRLLLDLPNCWEVHAAIAEVHEGLGQTDIALREYKRAISILKQKLLESR